MKWKINLEAAFEFDVWFAWYPVFCQDLDRMVWLEFVYRRRAYYRDIFQTYYVCEYNKKGWKKKKVPNGRT